MPKSTMREESEYKLPEDVPLPVVLEEVSVRTIRYTRDGKEKSFEKWEWDFAIAEGEYAGLHAYGETEDRLTSHPDNKVRQWAEVLRGVEFGIGEDLDTDDLIGLPGVVFVQHDAPREKKDGTNFYPCPVSQVFPEGFTGSPDGEENQDPPF